MEKITLNNETKSIRLELNPENKPYFVVRNLEFIPFDESLIYKSEIVVVCELSSRSLYSSKKSFYLSVETKNYQVYSKNDNYFDFVEFAIQDNEKKSDINYEINIYYDNVFFDLTKSIFDDFDEFYSLKSNTKIIFSAPFGQGKTTFLKHFFEHKGETVELFRLFPVNYSVSQNEDIFQYIKCEILLQLLEKENVVFDKEKLSHLYILPEFAKKNVHRILSPFLNLIPKVGGDLYKIYEKLYELSVEYFDYHDATQIDDVKKAEKFIEQLIEKEGSIFENNFFTQLIRQLISDIEERGKQSVLVIDDLDRIDPEHIFRILNVFAAHFDSDEKTQDGLSNKFGFDKIILVCDYHNLIKIFRHRYGIDTDYCGYINKFYSKEPYVLDSRMVIHKMINALPKRVEKRDDHVEVLKELLADMNLDGKISIREMLKFDVHDITQKSREDITGNCLHSTVYSLIKFLCRIIHPDELILRFGDLIKNESDFNSKYFGYCINALVALMIDDDFYSKTDPIKIEHPDYPNLSINLGNLNKGKNIFYFPDNPDTSKVKFTKKDFYSLLIDVVEKYKIKLQQSELLQ